MDLNIGTAFWFAARGEGYLRAYSEEEVDGFFSVKDNNVPLLRVNQSCVKDSGGMLCSSCHILILYSICLSRSSRVHWMFVTVGKLCSSRKEEGVVGKRYHECGHLFHVVESEAIKSAYHVLQVPNREMHTRGQNELLVWFVQSLLPTGCKGRATGVPNPQQ